MTPEQQDKLNRVFQWFEQMQASHSIPLSTDQAIRARFLTDFIKSTGITDIHATSRNQTTSAGGGDLVPQTFTDLIRIEHPITKQFIYIPYYT